MEIIINIEDNRTAKRGDIFMIEEEPYILAKIDYKKLGLVSLQTGNLWSDPQEVKDHNKVTSSELNRIACNAFLTKCKVTFK